MSPRILRDRTKKRDFYLDEPFQLTLSDGTILKIVDYTFNGHSVPRGLRWAFSRHEDIVAALAHDYMLDTMPWYDHGRKYADDVYYELMQDSPKWRRRTLMPLAVYVWGFVWSGWWPSYTYNPEPGQIIRVRVV
jgi:hypothetical protein